MSKTDDLPSMSMRPSIPYDQSFPTDFIAGLSTMANRHRGRYRGIIYRIGVVPITSIHYTRYSALHASPAHSSYASCVLHPTTLQGRADTFPSRQAQDGVHELVVVDLHPAVAVGVEPLERLADLLDDHARAHEAVERDPRRGARPSADGVRR